VVVAEDQDLHHLLVQQECSEALEEGVAIQHHLLAVLVLLVIGERPLEPLERQVVVAVLLVVSEETALLALVAVEEALAQLEAQEVTVYLVAVADMAQLLEATEEKD
jgi:hypothetical protein